MYIRELKPEYLEQIKISIEDYKRYLLAYGFHYRLDSLILAAKRFKADNKQILSKLKDTAEYKEVIKLRDEIFIRKGQEILL